MHKYDHSTTSTYSIIMSLALYTTSYHPSLVHNYIYKYRHMLNPKPQKPKSLTGNSSK